MDTRVPPAGDLNLRFQNAVGLEMSIPMPGHPIPPASVDKTKKDIATFERLVDEHDVVFQLMDSRESRWLPTVVGASKGKVGVPTRAYYSSVVNRRTSPRSCSTLHSVSIRT